MSPRQSRLEDLFHRAADLTPAERSALFDSECTDDPALRAEVESLLALDGSDVATVVERMTVEAASASVPQRLADFTIIRVIGEGGMGRVYEAQQDAPARRVALKVIRPGLVSGAILRRFTHEADVLAQLNHPGIAQIYQAGFAQGEPDAEGERLRTPYFAMELVRGPMLSEFVRARGLGTREIVALLADVCDAVQHAHQRGVIHRDLKPGNILVDTAGAQPLAKILDFGIARLTNAEADRVTMQTQIGQIIGTLGYMAPEQTEGAVANIDTRADVYALGVIAYELLAGRAPHDLSSLSMAAAIDRIRRIEPTPLGMVNPALAGDLETIVGKAMSKEPDARYASAGELGADLRRVLQDRPIVARPPSTTYLLRKFARRNKALVAAGVIAGVSVVAGAGVAVWQAVVATRQRDVARDAESRAGKIKQFLVDDVFGQTRLDRGGVKLTVVDALRNSAGTVPTKFADQPDLLIEIHQMLASMMQDAAMAEDAAREILSAQTLAVERWGRTDPRTLRILLDRRNILSTMGREGEMDTPVEQVAAMVDEHIGPLSGEALSAQIQLATARLQVSEPAAALTILHAALARQWPESVRTRMPFGYLLNVMTVSYRSIDNDEKALEWSQRTVDWMRANMPEGSPSYSSAIMIHGNLLYGVKKYVEAEAPLRQALEINRKHLRPNDDSIGYAALHLAMNLVRLGRPEEAFPLVQEGRQIIESSYGINHWETWLAWRREWIVLRELPDTAQLEAWHKALIDTTRNMEPRLREHHLDAIRWYGEFLVLQNRVDEARAVYEPVRDELHTLDPNGHTRAAADLLEGMIARRMNRTDEARAILQKARDFFTAKPFPLFPFAGERAGNELAALDAAESAPPPAPDAEAAPAEDPSDAAATR